MATSEIPVKDSQEKIIDPVCGMEVEPGRTRLVSLHQGQSYWFCADACRRAFEANPKKYLEPKPAKKKGWLGRYLAKMARVNEREFGCAGPKCH